MLYSQGVPEKIVHSDCFTPRTLRQPATIREHLVTHFWVIVWIVHPLVMVFCGLRQDGTFGLKFYRNQTLTGVTYHSLLQYTVLPELRNWNGGNLDQLYWQQDGATVHCTDRNMRYLDNQFGDHVISRRALRGREWPPRSPDLSPLDFFLWGFLKSKVLSFGLQESKLKIDIQCSGLHPKATQLGRVGNEHQKRSRSTWPSDDQQINYGHESKGSQMHHCWRRKLWVKTHDDEQIYCAKTTMYFQINTPLYCRTVLSINMLKKPENCFFFTENWQKRVLNLRNYQIKGPGLATGPILFWV